MALSVSAENVKSGASTRPIADFQPSIWGDRFLNFTPEAKEMLEEKEQHIKELKDEVRKELKNAAYNPPQQLILIDVVQRLGIGYHFEGEIEEALKHIYENRVDSGADIDLCHAALLFRLLRQEGFNISSEIFNKFKDIKGFKESLKDNVVGMLALYEAAHLRLHGEVIMDEALVFSTAQLESMVAHLSNPLATQVNLALKQPIRKRLPRLDARHFISIYEEDNSHNKILLKLAKLDFNLLQSLHKEELSKISKWWKDLDFKTKLPFIRDRVVENYFWALGVYFEPQYSLGRRILTKVIAISSAIDDIYDAYGTFEELELFTEAIDRWNINSMDKLPDYMKICYQALLDVYEEIEEEMMKEKRLYCSHCAKQTMKALIHAYFVEAKWRNEGDIPTTDEYLKVSLVSSGYLMLIAASFSYMGEIVTKVSFDWLLTNPKVVRASIVICRLMDDIVSHKFEQKREHVASAIECYMKEYGLSEQEVCNKFSKQVEDAWKDINQGFIRPTEVLMPLLTRVLNFSRVMEALYKYEDGYTNVGKTTQGYIGSMFIDPVPI